MVPQLTAQTQRVLLAMLKSPTEEQYGLELAKAAGLKSGTLYPILSRLEGAGWIVGSWERIDRHAEGRRPRRYYRLTASGVSVAEEVKASFEALVSGTLAPRWSSP